MSKGGNYGLLQVLAILAGLIIILHTMLHISSAEYHDTRGGYLLMILIVGGVLYALYMLAFEPEQVHDVNETLRTAPRI